jgi:uncharacterized coiled-coil DUF342 family protein
MMKKILSVLAVGLLLVAVACGGGKYADVKNVLEKNISATENFFNAMEKAGSADDVAAALTNYADEMDKLIPELKDVQKKYPELKDEEDMPKDVKELMEKYNKLAEKFPQAMSKIAQYAADSKVMEAQEKFLEVMSKMK